MTWVMPVCDKHGRDIIECTECENTMDAQFQAEQDLLSAEEIRADVVETMFGGDESAYKVSEDRFRTLVENLVSARSERMKGRG